jgi:hypothetical protein
MVAQIAPVRESKQGNFTERMATKDSGKARRICISLTRGLSGVLRQNITKISLEHFELLATTVGAELWHVVN